MNIVVLIGNLGQDPETREFEGGGIVANFSIATTRRVKKKGSDQWDEVTDWHQIVAWNGLAKVIRDHVRKGNKVGIQGDLTYRKYTTPSGDIKYVTEVVAQSLDLLTPKSANSGGPRQSNTDTRSASGSQFDSAFLPDNNLASSDDLPF